MVRQFYKLHAWVVMPNHVHVIFEPRIAMPTIMRSLKRENQSRRQPNSGPHGNALLSHFLLLLGDRRRKTIVCITSDAIRMEKLKAEAPAPGGWPVNWLIRCDIMHE